MSTLLLRLAGPMQSWGTQSRFRIRDTGLEPSKSGVVGLLCAALGRARAEPVDDLAALRMGVRVEREGLMKRDYHTAGGAHRQGETYGVYKANAAAPDTVTSDRYYLADADFLVGLESGDDELLGKLDAALARPVWQTFLGRKSLVPGVPVHIPGGLLLGVDLESALKGCAWPRMGETPPPTDRRPARLRFVWETDDAAGEEVRRDQPVGAAFLQRSFTLRHVRTTFEELGGVVPLREE
ncbi:MAG: type I-E CRISPR-associated protein Cas5/CasD [Chloroflexi bacterium]|nr:type I-E CRISPR-associated protein Cas5/CasD [Chloroflexota bacterium]